MLKTSKNFQVNFISEITVEIQRKLLEKFLFSRKIFKKFAVKFWKIANKFLGIMREIFKIILGQLYYFVGKCKRRRF